MTSLYQPRLGFKTVAKQGWTHTLNKGVGLGLNLANPLVGNVQLALAYNDAAGSVIRDYSGHNRHARLGKYISPTTVYSSPTGTIDAHIQGVADDGTNYFITTIHSIYKLARDGSIVASRSSVAADLPTTSPARDHIGQPAVYNGKLYAVSEYLNGVTCGSQRNMAIGIWNTSDLSYASYFDVSAQAAEVAAVCVDTDRSCLWTSSFCDSVLRRYDLTTGAYLGSITLDLALSGSNSIAYLGGLLWVDDGLSRKIFGVDPSSGKVQKILGWQHQVQGLGVSGSSLLIAFYDNVGGDTTQFTIYSVDPTITPNWSSRGYQQNKDYAVGIPYVMPDAGALVSLMAPTSIYSFNIWFDAIQSTYATNWEGWSDSSGKINARVTSADASGERRSGSSAMAAGVVAHAVYTWDKASTAELYVNGVANPSGSSTVATWTTPPDFLFLGGINPTNSTKSDWLRQADFVLDKHLSAGEAAALAADPYGLFSYRPHAA